MADQRPGAHAAVDHPGADLRGGANALGRDALELDAIYADRLGDQLLDDSIYSGKTAPDHADTMMIMPTDLTPVDDPFAAPKQPEVASMALRRRWISCPTIGLALSGRQEGSRHHCWGRTAAIS